ncbi:hypothetical protein CDL15_Pgr011928 [Punica granatum]|uniref:Uncharacterized protein n=1 Tax=Punica granatum TaxID=22663 RepID=A0A218WEI9_PUNGR|nr:hypothetical protein CDL15_Pgr011928 [Punica granatum]
MVRAPCCWRKGLKKGPWTAEEDEILRSFIKKHGHGNWRALPKHAGLLRCGKSCRLRWTNYLRPDVKRGNFTKEEEETIIKLHASLGNKWSLIASHLPGRTDNEVKNMWHTRLKKRVLNLKEHRPDGSNISIPSEEQSQEPSNWGSPPPPGFEVGSTNTVQVHDYPIFSPQHALEFNVESTSTVQVPDYSIFSPQHSYSGISRVLTGGANDYKAETVGTKIDLIDSLGPFPELDGSFWSDSVSADYSMVQWEFAFYGGDILQLPGEVDSFTKANNDQMGIWRDDDPNHLVLNDGLDFWYDLFVHSEGFGSSSNF